MNTDSYYEAAVVRTAEYRSVRTCLLDTEVIPVALFKAMSKLFTHQVMFTFEGVPMGRREMSDLLIVQRDCTQTIECNYEGQVDITLIDTTEFWDCPACGGENEVEVDLELGDDRER